ncbi:MAG: TonB-dependent receptor [Acidobacteriota bacterium]|nr:TonB-dependent receptor [Acidobacteriota bacterium]
MKKRLGVLVIVVLGVGFAMAQTFRGEITGTVTDSTGASVSGADVKATQRDTGLERTTVTDSGGDYNLPELPLGEYTVTITKAGFKTQTIKGVQVSVANAPRVNAQLSPGEVSQAIEVTADAPLVETTSNIMGGTIDAQQAEQLPVNGRDFIKLLTLVPGSTADASGVSDSPGAFGQFSVNGNRGRSNNYLLDGTDMNDGYRNDSAINEAGVFGTPATLLPVDAIAELSIMSSTEAEYGRNSGAIVNIVTKSGTNSWHGSVFEYFRNNGLDARNFFNTKDQPQDKFHNNQYGGSLGGPLVKDKTFFFLAYEAQNEIIGIPTLSTIPTEEMITCFGAPVNTVAQNILDLNPWGQALPATGDSPCGPSSVQQSNTSTNTLHSLIFKVDQHVGRSDVLTGRYFYGTSKQSFPLALVGGSGIPGYNTVTPTDVHVISVSYTHIFSPRLLMENRFGWNSFDEDFFPQDSTLDPASLGLETGVPAQDFGLPLLTFGDVSPIGATTSVPRGRVDRNWQLFTNFSYSTGRHNWKWGGEYRRTTVKQFFDSGFRARLNFDDFFGFLAGMPSGGRQATTVASGTPLTPFSGTSLRNTAQNNFGLYLQDSWKVFPRFTVNYGLRWDYFGVISEGEGQFSNFDPTLPGPVLTDQLYPKDWTNFGPRVSFAWDVFGSGKTVVRGGWGMFYDAFSQDFFIGQLPFNTFNPGPAYNGVGPNPTLFSFSPSGPLTPGVPVFDPTSFSAADVFTVDQGIRTPYIQNYNLNIEQQLGAHAAVQVSYVGSAGRKLFRYRDINQCVNPAIYGMFTPGTCFPGAAELGSPFGAAGFEYINNFESSASSTYDALQASFRIKSWHGLSSVVNYTWSHSIDNASDGQDFVAQATQPDNSYTPQFERANSNFDTRNRFSWNWTYEFPKSSTMPWLLSGWEMDGVLTLMDGQPYNLTYQFEDDFNGSGEYFGRPDVIASGALTGTNSFNLVNLGAFAAPCLWDTTLNGGDGGCVPGSQHFGNLRRNAYMGPSFKNFDYSIVKNTKLGERVTMQIRADVFNLFNHPNFTNPTLPNFAVDFFNNGSAFVPTVSATQGFLTGTGFLNPVATPDVGIGNPFLGGGGPRNIQIAVKFTF